MKFQRAKLHDLGNNIGENPKKSCNCKDCIEIKNRAKRIFKCKFFTIKLKKYISNH